MSDWPVIVKSRKPNPSAPHSHQDSTCRSALFGKTLLGCRPRVVRWFANCSTNPLDAELQAVFGNQDLAVVAPCYFGRKRVGVYHGVDVGKDEAAYSGLARGARRVRRRQVSLYRGVFWEGAFDQQRIRATRQPDHGLAVLGVAGVHERSAFSIEPVGDALGTMLRRCPREPAAGELDGGGALAG